MKAILVLASFSLGLFLQAQTSSQENHDLLVLKFTCGTSGEHSRVVSSVQDPGPSMNEPFTITQIPKNEPQEVKNRRDLDNRQAELRGLDADANRSRQPAPRKVYFYHLEFKNTGPKIVKSFAWQYQANEVPDAALDRQFFCAIRTKPSETKQLDLFSPLAPSRVVDASKVESKTSGDKTSIIINKIEFIDGSVWQRIGWNPVTFSADATGKVQPGRCIGI
jgi:hypothetical protein